MEMAIECLFNRKIDELKINIPCRCTKIVILFMFPNSTLTYVLQSAFESSSESITHFKLRNKVLGVIISIPSQKKTTADMVHLVEIPRIKWPELRDLYRSNWPNDAIAYRFLDTQISYPGLAQFCNVKVYSPDGDITDGFVSIFFNLDKAYDVMIHPLKSIDKMEKALGDMKTINWTGGLYISSASSVVEECMRRLEKPLGIKTKTDGYKALKHFLDRSSKQFDISKIPPDTYTADLKHEHLRIVDETWTFHSERSYEFFQSLLENHLTYALYSTKDNSPLAWVTISWEGSLTHLYTVEDHRRKGYSEYILKVAVNDQLSKGKDLLGFTLKNNFKAQKLFDKLNFERIGFVTWIIIEKE